MLGIDHLFGTCGVLVSGDRVTLVEERPPSREFAIQDYEHRVLRETLSKVSTQLLDTMWWTWVQSRTPANSKGSLPLQMSHPFNGTVLFATFLEPFLPRGDFEVAFHTEPALPEGDSVEGGFYWELSIQSLSNQFVRFSKSNEDPEPCLHWHVTTQLTLYLVEDSLTSIKLPNMGHVNTLVVASQASVEAWRSLYPKALVIENGIQFKSLSLEELLSAKVVIFLADLFKLASYAPGLPLDHPADRQFWMQRNRHLPANECLLENITFHDIVLDEYVVRDLLGDDPQKTQLRAAVGCLTCERRVVAIIRSRDQIFETASLATWSEAWVENALGEVSSYLGPQGFEELLATTNPDLPLRWLRAATTLLIPTKLIHKEHTENTLQVQWTPTQREQVCLSLRRGHRLHELANMYHRCPDCQPAIQNDFRPDNLTPAQLSSIIPPDETLSDLPKTTGNLSRHLETWWKRARVRRYFSITTPWDQASLSIQRETRAQVDSTRYEITILNQRLATIQVEQEVYAKAALQNLVSTEFQTPTRYSQVANREALTIQISQRVNLIRETTMAIQKHIEAVERARRAIKSELKTLREKEASQRAAISMSERPPENCGICRASYENGAIFSCGHAFCMNCVESLFAAVTNISYWRYQQLNSAEISCPMCRSVIPMQRSTCSRFVFRPDIEERVSRRARRQPGSDADSEGEDQGDEAETHNSIPWALANLETKIWIACPTWEHLGYLLHQLSHWVDEKNLLFLDDRRLSGHQRIRNKNSIVDHCYDQESLFQAWAVSEEPLILLTVGGVTSKRRLKGSTKPHYALIFDEETFKAHGDLQHTRIDLGDALRRAEVPFTWIELVENNQA